MKHTYKSVVESFECPDDKKYLFLDLSDEQERVVNLPGMKTTIKNPVCLIIRDGGVTHRVVTEDGNVYCYAAPETGRSIVTWKSKEGLPPVKF